MIEIIEAYSDYEAPQAVLKSLKRLIRYTPEKYLSGLGYIKLTDTSALNREQRRGKTKSRKKSVYLHDALGWYAEKWEDESAHIILLVDNILGQYPKKSLRFGYIVDIALGRTFFHEVGHHIHKTKIPEYREKENVADDWRNRLYENFFKKCYWYYYYPFLLISPLFLMVFKLYLKKRRQK